MHHRRCLRLLSSLLVVGCGLGNPHVLAAAPFAIAAGNLTMPSVTKVTTSDGVTSIQLGSSQFTVTGIPGAGTVTIGCQYTGPATEAKIPQQCGTAGAPGIPIAAGQTTLNGVVNFVPYGEGPIPGLSKLDPAPRPSSRLPATGITLAGATLLGLGLRRRAHRRFLLTAFAVGAMAVLAGVGGCGADPNGMTPGNYQYTITATYAATPNTPLGVAASTNITLTVL